MGTYVRGWGTGSQGWGDGIHHMLQDGNIYVIKTAGRVFHKLYIKHWLDKIKKHRRDSLSENSPQSSVITEPEVSGDD